MQMHGYNADMAPIPVYVGPDGLLSGVPRIAVVPEVSATAQAFQRFGDATNTIFYFRVAINAGSDIEAGVALSTGQTGVPFLRPDSDVAITSDLAITRVDIVAVGSAESATLASGEIVVEDTATSTAADYQTAMVTFTFDSADIVKTVILSASDRQTNDVTVQVDGRSHA